MISTQSRTKVLFLVACALSSMAAACTSARESLVTLPAVSMSESTLNPAKMGTDLGPVTARYCAGETPNVAKTSKVGLLDEVTHLAQAEKKASYIMDAQYFRQGNCVILEGKAVR